MYSVLSYGAYGTGKTTFGVSAFWDIMANKPVEGRSGRWLLIGRESNDALGVPEEMIKRFPAPEKDPIKFIKDFSAYLKILAMAGAKGQGPTDIVVDGWTELNSVFIWAYDESVDAKNQFESWREWKREFLGAIQKLHPDVLKANIFGTARIGQLRKGTTTKTGEKIGEDPDYMADFKYYPAMEGWARYEPVLLIGPHGSPKSFLRVIEELVQNCLDADKEYLMDSEVDARVTGLYGNQCCESGCCIGELHEPSR